jgi:DNA topoisomerase 2-associated protein PAT1
MLTLLIACFSQLDVVLKAHALEDVGDAEERAEVDRQTQAFLTGVLQSILPPIVKGNLRLITGLLGLLLDRERNDVVLLSKTKVSLKTSYFELYSHQ